MKEKAIIDHFKSIVLHIGVFILSMAIFFGVTKKFLEKKSKRKRISRGLIRMYGTDKIILH